MKKTIYMLPALALMLFAACSSEDAVTKESPAQLNETPDNAIGFGAYVNRSVTRAGAPGLLTTSGGTPNLQTVGFGVFAYYGDGDLYSENLQPNFMYNQWVHYTSKWEYEPVKYWPNEFGQSAVSTGVDRVSFFAYAPYVEVTPNTGQLTSTYNKSDTEHSTATGITALTRNGKTGDPYVKYVGVFNPSECVDLCYGVSAEDYTSSVGAGDGTNKITTGKPFLNVAKPSNGADLKFLFKHALAKLTVKVDADVNVTGHNDTGDGLDGMTRVWIRSITFDGIAPRGYLNLNSGMWYDAVDNDKISRASVTIHDGRRDGLEASADDSYESPIGINSNLVQNEPYVTGNISGIQYSGITTPETSKGVTDDYQNLFGNATNGAIYVIPANEQLKATIVYDVETADATLPTYLSDGTTNGSTVENKITKYITVGGAPLKLESGKQYTLNLHLGLNSVEFSATVEDSWTPGETPDDTWLPQNAPIASLAAGPSPGTETNITVSAAGVTKAFFEVTGLTPEASADLTADGNASLISSTPATATASGKVTAQFSVATNTSVNNQSGSVTVTQGSNSAKLNIIQLARPLGLTVATPPNAVDNSSIVLGTGATLTTDDWTAATVTIFRTRNGITSKLVVTTDYTISNTGVISFQSGKEAQLGDIYSITVQAGDAAAETVTFTVQKAAGTLSGFTDNSNVDYNIQSPSSFIPQTLTVGVGEDGHISYSIDKIDNVGSTEAEIDNLTGNITINNPEAGDKYKVTATVSDGANYTYAEKSRSYTITIVDVTP